MIEPNLFLKNEVANIAGVQGVQWNPPLFPKFLQLYYPKLQNVCLPCNLNQFY